MTKDSWIITRAVLLGSFKKGTAYVYAGVKLSFSDIVRGQSIHVSNPLLKPHPAT